MFLLYLLFVAYNVIIFTNHSVWCRLSIYTWIKNKCRATTFLFVFNFTWLYQPLEPYNNKTISFLLNKHLYTKVTIQINIYMGVHIYPPVTFHVNKINRMCLLGHQHSFKINYQNKINKFSNYLLVVLLNYQQCSIFVYT